MKGLNGLKFAQFGLFLILLGFTVNLFSYGLFAGAFAITFMSAEYAELGGKLAAWGVSAFPVAMIVQVIGKLLCAGAPEETARNYIIASIVADISIIGIFIFMFGSAASGKGFGAIIASFLMGMIAIVIAAVVSYIMFLKFLGRMGDNVGEPRVGQYTGILMGLIGTSVLFGGISFVSPGFGGLGSNLLAVIISCLFNYTIWVLFRALPLYIREVEEGITDATESGQARREAEEKERRAGPGGGGPSQAKEPEEPKGEPPTGHLLYRIPKGLETLHMAVKEGDRVKVETAIAQGASPTQTVRHGLSPLHIASSVGVMEVADVLLKSGADVNQTCETGLTPIYFAIQSGNPNMVGYLINKGANLFHQNESGYTPLHWACSAPHPKFIGPVRSKMVNLLISQGADIHAQTQDGRTAKDLAVEQKLEESLATLDRHLNVNQPSPMASEVVIEETQVTEQVLTYPPFVGVELATLPKNLSSFHDAIKDGDPEKVQHQFAAGGKVTDALPGGVLPVHITGVTGVMSVTEMLLRFGADINSVCDHNLTTMFFAVYQNNYNMVGYLVSRGAKINHQDSIGRTALHWAAAVPTERLAGNNRVKMVKFILDQGGDPNIQDNSGFTPLELARAADIEDIVNLLESRMGVNEPEEAGEAASSDADDYYV